MRKTLKGLLLAPILLLAGCKTTTTTSNLPGIIEIHDIPYTSNQPTNPKQTLDLYLPENTHNNPVLIYTYGGSLTAGSKTRVAHMAQQFAKQGIIVAAVDYRLHPEVSYPAPVEDLAQAVRWVYDNIKKHGGNQHNLFLAGHSSGAYLTLMITLDPAFLTQVNLNNNIFNGVIAISALTDLSRDLENRIGTVWPNQPKSILSASPVNIAHASTPPMLLMYALNDWPDRRIEMQDLYRALLQAHNDDVTVKVIPDRNHTSIQDKMTDGDETFETTLTFIHDHTKQKA